MGVYKVDEDVNCVVLYSYCGKNILVFYFSLLGGIWVVSEVKGVCYYFFMIVIKSVFLYCYNKVLGLLSNSILVILEFGNGDVWIVIEV